MAQLEPLSPQALKRGFAVLIGVPSIVLMGAWLGYFWGCGCSRSNEICAGCAAQKAGDLETGKRKEIFDGMAKEWDNHIYWDEFFGRILLYRRKLVKNFAEGAVLEVAAGTGKNMK